MYQVIVISLAITVFLNSVALSILIRQVKFGHVSVYAGRGYFLLFVIFSIFVVSSYIIFQSNSEPQVTKVEEPPQYLQADIISKPDDTLLGYQIIEEVSPAPTYDRALSPADASWQGDRNTPAYVVINLFLSVLILALGLSRIGRKAAVSELEV